MSLTTSNAPALALDHVQVAVHRLWSGIRDEISGFKAFYVPLIAAIVFTWLATFYFEDELFPTIEPYLNRVKFLWIMVPGVLLMVLFSVTVLREDKSPKNAMKWLGGIIFSNRFLGVLTFGSLTYAMLMAVFLYWKMKIPMMAPFSWDATFAAWDGALFGGQQGYEFLMPVLGFPAVTRTLDFLYTLWGLYGIFFWVVPAMIPAVASELRKQFWLCTLIVWFGAGLVLATLLSSAGPVYYGYVTGDTELYSGLHAYLDQFGKNGTPLNAVAVQDILYQVSIGKLDGIGGISAMPSLHNAHALMFVLFSFRLNKWLGYFMSAFMLATALGSVHLGWHYFVDALVAWAIVFAVWRFAGWVVADKPAEAAEPAEAAAAH